MENKEETQQLDYCLWDPRKRIHPNKPKGLLLYGASSLKPSRLGSMLSWSTSAKDLRELDIEKEKEDETSPRGVLEACAKEFNNSHESQQQQQPFDESKATSRSISSRARSRWGKFFKLWKIKSTKNHLPSLHTLSIPKFRWKSKTFKEDASSHSTLSNGLYTFKSALITFTLSELHHATNNFSSENLIGKGGFAEVYQGCLEEGKLIAVKKITNGSIEEKTACFLSELGVIAHIDHPNTAKIIGCCVEGEMHLVFALSPLGSLGSLLHGPNKEKLDWSKRYKIALGIADGLLYLHESCHRRIIHRDIKGDNILLTEKFDPQAKPLLEAKNIEALVDPSLGDDYDKDQIGHVVFTASKCIEQSPLLRPCMSEVVALLRGDKCELETTSTGQRKALQRTYSEELLDAQEYNSTRYLRDLSRHRQLALGSCES
ncbi:hypothetical protein PIB30_071294 [Stylosanthes scabra]|uniref:Protein kinase domain-containing protein n=1 Tax=Stylosanthes scabra TaxID=79078 RepID=A0ABU6QPU5_9FABA|nr:hypothetical protein [Stylosanthes scabra]